MNDNWIMDNPTGDRVYFESFAFPYSDYKFKLSPQLNYNREVVSVAISDGP